MQSISEYCHGTFVFVNVASVETRTLLNVGAKIWRQLYDLNMTQFIGEYHVCTVKTKIIFTLSHFI